MAENPYARSLALITQPSSLAMQPTHTAVVPAKPSVWQAYRELIAPTQPAQSESRMQSAMTGLRHNAEGAAIGALLGFIEAKLGSLDLGGKYPVDGIAAFLLYALSIRDAGSPNGLSSDIRAVSQSLTTVAFYRKVKEAASAPKPDVKDNMPGHKTTAKGKDSIVEAAKEFGLLNDKAA